MMNELKIIPENKMKVKGLKSRLISKIIKDYEGQINLWCFELQYNDNLSDSQVEDLKATLQKTIRKVNALKDVLVDLNSKRK